LHLVGYFHQKTPVKVSLVVRKFKDHTNKCTTHVIKEKSPKDGGKDGSCGFPLWNSMDYGGGFTMRPFSHGLIYNVLLCFPPVIK